MALNQIKIGIVFSYISLFLGNFISLIYTPYMLRMLGQSEYGLMSLSASTIGYLTLLNFGLTNAIVRYVAKYRALNNKQGEYNIIGFFLILFSIIAFVVLIVGVLLISNIELLFENSMTLIELERMKILMWLMLFNLVISLPFGVFGAVIHANEKFLFVQAVSVITQILNPIVLVIVLFYGYKSVGLTIVSTAFTLGGILINIYYFFGILKYRVKFRNIEWSLFREILNYSGFVFLSIMVDRIFWSTDQIILGSVSGTVAVSVYAIATTFNRYFVSFSSSLTSLLLPRITNMSEQKADNEISDLFIKTGRLQFFILFLIITGFVIFGQTFIKIWAGIEYLQAYYIALVIMVPLTIPLCQNLGISILQAQNKHRFRAKMYFVIAIFNVIISIPLARKWGGIGCALASSLAYIIGHNIIMNIYYYRIIRIDIPQFFKELYNIMLPLIPIPFLFYFIQKFYLLESENYIQLGFRILIYVLVFSLIAWKFSLNTYERGIIKVPLKRIKSKIYEKLN